MFYAAHGVILGTTLCKLFRSATYKFYVTAKAGVIRHLPRFFLGSMRRICSRCTQTPPWLASRCSNVFPQPFLTLSTLSRQFWGPFASDAAKKKKMLSNAASKVASEQIERNEKLVNASLSILNTVQECRGAGSSSSSDDATIAVDANSVATVAKMSPERVSKLEGVVTMLFAAEGMAMAPSAQFDLVYDVLCFEELHEAGAEEVMGHVLLVLDSIVPEMLFDVFTEAGLGLFTLREPKQVFLVRRLAHLLLGDLDLFLIPNPFNVCCQDAGEIDVDAILVELSGAVPCVSGLPSFTALQASANELVLKARLFALLRDLCASFDPEKTGKILLKEFEDCLHRVVGPEKAAGMLAGIKPDESGRIPYQHVTATLTRPFHR